MRLCVPFAATLTAFSAFASFPSSAQADPIELHFPSVGGTIIKDLSATRPDEFFEALVISFAPPTVFVPVLEYFASTLRPDAGYAIRGTIYASATVDTGPRTIDLLLYPGDGQITTSDALGVEVRIGSVTYHPKPDGTDSSVTFQLEMTRAMRALIQDGADFAGIRFRARNPQAFSHLSFQDLPKLVIDHNPVPEPGTLLLVMSGLATLLRKRVVRPS